MLCVDEKSQIQVLSRTQPVLPMCTGQLEPRAHDYIREFLSAHNGQPKPFRWIQSADHILASIARCPATTLAAHAPAIYARNQ